jgi:hypothetical protein
MFGSAITINYIKIFNYSYNINWFWIIALMYKQDLYIVL